VTWQGIEVCCKSSGPFDPIGAVTTAALGLGCVETSFGWAPTGTRLKLRAAADIPETFLFFQRARRS